MFKASKHIMNCFKENEVQNISKALVYGHLMDTGCVKTAKIFLNKCGKTVNQIERLQGLRLIDILSVFQKSNQVVYKYLVEHGHFGLAKKFATMQQTRSLKAKSVKIKKTS